MNQNYKNIMNTLTSISNESIFTGTPNNEYHSLFMGVILRALLDVSKPSTSVETSSIKVDRLAARSWFFATSGVTCENFEYVCDIAGINPMAMRSVATKVLQRKDISNVRKEINSFFNREN